MLKINRLIIILAIAVLSALCLSGCNDRSSDSSGGAAETQQTAPSDQSLPSDQNESGGHPDDEHHNNSSSGTSDIGYDRVIEIVLAKVPGATADSVTEIETEYENGRIEYEGELWYNGYEYEFEIDGATGNILKWEIDR